MSTVQVEFFGIPRLRAGLDRLTLPGHASMWLSDVFSILRERCPGFADSCLEGTRLKAGFLACIDGGCFTDQDVPVKDGASVLILSADAGG